MVTITNGEKTFRVTSGAVKPYENMGFHVVSDIVSREMKQVEQHSSIPDFTSEKDTEEGSQSEIGTDGTGEDGMSVEEATFISELLEHPLTQWTNDEVKEFVRIKGIDTSGAQKVSQVRSIIKAYLEEEQKNNM